MGMCQIWTNFSNKNGWLVGIYAFKTAIGMFKCLPKLLSQRTLPAWHMRVPGPSYLLYLLYRRVV